MTTPPIVPSNIVTTFDVENQQGNQANNSSIWRSRVVAYLPLNPLNSLSIYKPSKETVRIGAVGLCSLAAGMVTATIGLDCLNGGDNFPKTCKNGVGAGYNRKHTNSTTAGDDWCLECKHESPKYTGRCLMVGTAFLVGYSVVFFSVAAESYRKDIEAARRR